MKRSHFAGLMLWRGGVVLVAGYVAYQALRAALPFTDSRLELAISVMLTGVLFVFVSVVVERIQDAGAERRQGE